jgi:hypothetical protein
MVSPNEHLLATPAVEELFKIQFLTQDTVVIILYTESVESQVSDPQRMTQNLVFLDTNITIYLIKIFILFKQVVTRTSNNLEKERTIFGVGRVPPAP